MDLYVVSAQVDIVVKQFVIPYSSVSVGNRVVLAKDAVVNQLSGPSTVADNLGEMPLAL